MNLNKPRIVFGTDGIRGIAGTWPFIPPVAVFIGYALGRFVLKHSDHPIVVIGRDTRPSGSWLMHCLIAGLLGEGVDIIDLGVMTTPGIAFLARRQQTDLGIIVSASHNPLEFNGIKLVGSHGLRLEREEEIQIETLIQDIVASDLELKEPFGQWLDGHHLIEFYIQDHVQRCPSDSLTGLRVILDCADGASSRVAPHVFARLGADIMVLNDAAEGKSINHQCGSEYVRAHPEYLTAILKDSKRAYGFAFDGDGDRLTVLDQYGQVYDGDDLLYILAMHYHSEGRLRGNSVVITELANSGLRAGLIRKGISTIEANKGDRSLEQEMWRGDYLLGGETGGNIIINDGFHTAADAVYAALVLGGLLVRDHDLDLRHRTRDLQKHPRILRTLGVASKLGTDQKAQALLHEYRTNLGEEGRIISWDSTTEEGKARFLVEGSLETGQDEVERIADSVYQALLHYIGQSSQTPADGRL